MRYFFAILVVIFPNGIQTLPPQTVLRNDEGMASTAPSPPPTETKPDQFIGKLKRVRDKLNEIIPLNLGTRLFRIEGDIETLQKLIDEVNDIKDILGLNADGSRCKQTRNKHDNSMLFEGCNLHVRNGEDETASTNGLGNIIIGYNDNGSMADDATKNEDKWSGSHNLVVGPGHTYSSYGGIVAGKNNAIEGIYSSVLGGEQNVASGKFSTVSAGYNNMAENEYSTVSGGGNNKAEGSYSSVSGGTVNRARSHYTSILGGSDNRAGKEGDQTKGEYAAVVGGKHNEASGSYAIVGGGEDNRALGQKSVVLGGLGNTAKNETQISSSETDNEFNGYNIVLGGVNNTASGLATIMVGGENQNNQNATEDFSIWLGGSKGDGTATGCSQYIRGNGLFMDGCNLHVRNGENEMASTNSAGNIIIGYYDQTSGNATQDKKGSHNLVVGPGHTYLSYGGIVAGNNNAIEGIYSSVLGGELNVASGNYSTVSAGYNNTAVKEYSTVSGGKNNAAMGGFAAVSGGEENEAKGESSSVLGGKVNDVSGKCGVVLGGENNTVGYGGYSVIVGGGGNVASGDNSVVLGGFNNKATSEMQGGNSNIKRRLHEISGQSSRYSTVLGGSGNSALGGFSTLLGGQNQMVTGEYSTKGQLGGDGCTQYQEGKEYYMVGCNLNIRNGNVINETATTNSFGNIIIGYNEAKSGDTSRTKYSMSGSHNLVIGPGHTYSAYGGIVAGKENTIEGMYSSVLGGKSNIAIGNFSSVSGGTNNLATGSFSSLSGGINNTGYGKFSSVLGGEDNQAIGNFSSIAGGQNARALCNHTSLLKAAKSSKSCQKGTKSTKRSTKSPGKGSTKSPGKGSTKSPGKGSSNLQRSSKRPEKIRRVVRSKQMN